MRIAFFGLGTMGLPMATRLVGAGHEVVGFDLDAAASERFGAAGGAMADTAADAASRSDVAVTMLPEADHVRACLFGPDGVAAGLPDGAIVVEMSTIHPLASDAIRTDLAERGFAMVDAPVGRTSKHARIGRLLVMAGGAPEHLARVTPVFEAVGESTIDCGGPGCGIRMKIVNNFMSAALNALSAEALTLAEASGLDVGRTLEVLAGTPAGRGHFTTTYPEKAFAGDRTPDFMLRLARKDLAIANEFAEALGAPSALGPAALARYDAAQAAGHAAEDWTALYPFTRSEAGLPDD